MTGEILENINALNTENSENPLGSKEEKNYNMLAFILNGSIRRKIYFCLLKRPCYAWEIARKHQLDVSSVYRAIKALKLEKVIECLNPDSKRRKFYQLTRNALDLEEDVLASNN